MNQSRKEKIKSKLGSRLPMVDPNTQLVELVRRILRDRDHEKEGFRVIVYEKVGDTTRAVDCFKTWRPAVAFFSTLEHSRSNMLVYKKDSVYRVVFYDRKVESEERMRA